MITSEKKKQKKKNNYDKIKIRGFDTQLTLVLAWCNIIDNGLKISQKINYDVSYARGFDTKNILLVVYRNCNVIYCGIEVAN